MAEIRVEALRTKAFGAITGTYSALGPIFTHPIIILTLQNYTDVGITFSFDGVTDHYFLPAGGQRINDACANHPEVDNDLAYSNRTQLWVKGSPTSGNVYASAEYVKRG